MTRRHLIRMDDDEVAAFLAEQHLLQLATIDHDGWPHLVTMWYALLDGQIAFWTYAKSQKAVNLHRDQRLTCLIETGDDYPDARGVQIKGQAVITADYEAVRRVGQAVWERAAGPPDAGIRAMVDKQAAKRIAVFVRPLEVASWDHRKLAGAY
jgi:PPOX class probable F420-dependent enzyme